MFLYEDKRTKQDLDVFEKLSRIKKQFNANEKINVPTVSVSQYHSDLYLLLQEWK